MTTDFLVRQQNKVEPIKPKNNYTTVVTTKCQMNQSMAFARLLFAMLLISDKTSDPVLVSFSYKEQATQKQGS